MAVRLEKVVLDLDDRFSGPATKAAAAAALLHREVDGINKAGRDTDRSLSGASRSIGDTGNSARRAGSDIDRFSGRLRLIADAVAVLGPGLVPIGAVGIPAVAGLAAQMGFAAVGAGTMVLAFQGVGDALTAVNDAALAPTTENLAKAREAMAQLGPDAQEFVRAVQDARPAFEALRDSAAAGVFPGLTESLGPLVDDVFPRLEGIAYAVGDAMGSLAVDATDALAGPQWGEFLTFVEENAPQALSELGHTIGNVAGGLADLWMAFDPLNDDVSGWLLDISEGFADWASNLSETEGFADFMAYLRETGPQVAETLGALADAIIDIVSAAAPLGGPVLKGIEGLARAVSAIAESDMGTPIMIAVAALSAFNRASSVMDRVSGSGWAKTIRGAEGSVAAMATARDAMMRAGAGAGYLALSMTDVDEKAGVSNTAMGALLGTMIMPGWGTAIGTIAGGALDIKGAMDDASASTENLMDAIAHGTRGEISSGIEQVQSDLAELQEDQDNFWSLRAEPGENMWQMLGSNINAIVGNSGEMENALHAGRDAMTSSNDAADMLAGTVGETASQLGRARVQADLLSTSLSILEGFFDRRAAVRNYEQSLDDLRAGLRKGAQAWDADTQKGRDNLEMLDANAGAILQVAEQIENRRARRSFLEDARKDLIGLSRTFPAASDAIGQVVGRLDKHLDDFARPRTARLDVEAKKATDKTIGAIGDLMTFGKQKPKATLDANDKPAKDKINSTDHLLGILSGRKATPSIDVTSNASTLAAQTNAILSSIPDEIVQIHTVRSGRGGQGSTVGGTVADGGTIPGQRWPYGDRDFYQLAPGEEVVSNRFGQADRHRELLKAINSNRYADGGTVEGRWHSAPSSTVRVVERVVERLPSEFRVSTDLGDLVLVAVDDRIGDHREHDARNAATTWAGVTSD